MNLTENTFLIFNSDNGGIRDISYQTPLRAGKGSYYEGGIGIPLIIRWPGKIEAGSKSDFLVTHMDFYPTIRSIIKAEARPGEVLDGHDFTLLFSQQALNERPLFWHFPIYLQAYNPKEDGGRDPLFRTRPGSVMRNGKWKLHHYFEEDDYELYNLEEDPGERFNIAADHHEVIAEIQEVLAQHKAGLVPVENQLEK